MTDLMEELASDWELTLKATNRSKDTIRLYRRHVRYLGEWLAENALPAEPPKIDRAILERYFAELAGRKTRRNGRDGEQVKPAYVAAVYRSLQQFWRWLAREDEISENPFDKMKPPTVPEQPVPVLPDRAVQALLKTCAGREFEQLRDCAMIRLFLDTGVRVSGLAGITVDDVNFETDTVRVVLKGGSDLVLPFGAKTSDALRRYRRARGREPKADRFDAFWLATRGRGPIKAGGIRQMLERRAADAKLPEGVNPHMFRHYFAHTWLANGGQETDLMRLTGWKSREMVGRYAASAADDRAREAHKRAALGDRF